MIRSAVFGILFMWLVLITYLVSAVVVYDDTGGLVVNNALVIQEIDEDAGVFDKSTTLLGVYFKSLTFSVEGLPVMFNLMFQVPTAIMGFMLVEIIRGS